MDASYGAMTVMYAVEAGPGQITTSPTYVPFDTQVHVGPIDTKDPTNLEMRPITNGTFTVRSETIAARYRLIFTGPDGVDVEIQSQLVNADFVLPRIGRLDRGTAVSGSLVPVAFTNGPDSQAGGWHDLRVLTTGLWSILEQGPCCSSAPPPAKVDYNYATSLSGPLGVPAANATYTDTLAFTDSVSDDTLPLSEYKRTVYGYATVTLDGFDGSGTPINLVASAWKTPSQTNLGLHPPSSALTPYAERVVSLLNLPQSAIESQPDTRIAGGVIAAANVMPFTEILLNQSVNVESVSGDLDHAVFVPLSWSQLDPIQFVNPYNGVDAPMYPTAVFVKGSVKRTFTNSSATVRSGIQAIALQSVALPEVSFGDGVGVASAIKMKPSSLPDATATTTVLLADPEATKTLTRNAPSTGVKTFDLWFSSDSVDTSATIDDCSITIYQIGSSTITPVKRYLTNELPTTTVPLVIDQGVFDSTHTYALGISCYHGHPMVKSGDWRTVVYPVAASTIYTKSFTVP